MKLTVIGGAGVRAPLMIGSLAKRARALGLREVSVYDIDPRKTRLMSALSRALLESAGSPFRYSVAATPEEALAGTDVVITTIREGFEAGRARDERLCVEHGAIGQETTGAAGFAFACRSIPSLLRYARLTFDLNPNAWLLNFTNPAGLVTQALRKEGYDRVIGICDSADSARRWTADHLKIGLEEIESRVTGLNHLSVTTSVTVNGKERLPELLDDDLFISHAMSVFPKDLVRRLRCHLNEYLYYFFLKEEALSAMLKEPKTRGEQVEAWNADLMERISLPVEEGRMRDALDLYFGYVRKRNESYMEYAREGERYLPGDDEEGYAGVALDLVSAIREGRSRRMALCVPNGGTLPDLASDDVIEATCEVGPEGVRPLAALGVPDEARSLIREVKTYETLAVEAIRSRRPEGAVEALTAHPLIRDAAKARLLFQAFRNASEAYFTDWR